MPIPTLTLLPTPLLSLPLLHLILIRMLRRIKHIQRPLAPHSPLHNHRQLTPDRRRHRDEDAGVVQVLLVLWPAGTFLVTLLGAGTLLEGEAGDEEEEGCEEDEADARGV